MTEGTRPRGPGWALRVVAYFLLAVVAALVAPIPNALTIYAFWFLGIALFEVGCVVYRCSW